MELFHQVRLNWCPIQLAATFFQLKYRANIFLAIFPASASRDWSNTGIWRGAATPCRVCRWFWVLQVLLSWDYCDTEHTTRQGNAITLSFCLLCAGSLWTPRAVSLAAVVEVIRTATKYTLLFLISTVCVSAKLAAVAAAFILLPRMFPLPKLRPS